MIRYNIDHLLLREGHLFAYGWGFSPGTDVASLMLCLDFGPGIPPVEIEADYWQQRDDVKVSFPGLPEAGNAGFVLLAGLDSHKITRAFLRWELKDHRVIEIPLDLPQDEKSEKPSKLIRHYKDLLWKGITLLRSDGSKALMSKAKRYLSDQTRIGAQAKWYLLKSKLHKQPLTIVIDHDMGGGANIYRNKYVAERLAEGEIVLLLGYDISNLQYFVEFFCDHSSQRYSVKSPEVLLSLAAQSEVRHVIYNCAVSFRRPLVVIDTLIALKQNAGCDLLLTAHDYYMVCPSHNLIDNNGRFCGVPDDSKCKVCLLNHRDKFVSMSGARSIECWRREWSRLLTAADEVRIFSESSRRLLKRAYPFAPDATWRVAPHVLHTQATKVDVLAGTHLHIGIVGTIGKHKGSEIVGDLASEIIRRSSNTKITVIGTIDAKVPSNVVAVTGTYEPSQLSKLIKKSGANIFLFPSIWAETFSYVSHELVAMELPFACFDFGAPADLARSYEKGLVLRSMNAGSILDELESFWRESYQVEAII